MRHLVFSTDASFLTRRENEWYEQFSTSMQSDVEESMMTPEFLGDTANEGHLS